MPRNALGRGLGALIREPEPQVAPQPAPAAIGAVSPPIREIMSAGPQQIDIDLIEPSPFQPRTRFREEALEELARSIKASGILLKSDRGRRVGLRITINKQGGLFSGG